MDIIAKFTNKGTQLDIGKDVYHTIRRSSVVPFIKQGLGGFKRNIYTGDAHFIVGRQAKPALLLPTCGIINARCLDFITRLNFNSSQCTIDRIGGCDVITQGKTSLIVVIPEFSALQIRDYNLRLAFVVIGFTEECGIHFASDYMGMVVDGCDTITLWVSRVFFAIDCFTTQATVFGTYMLNCLSKLAIHETKDLGARARQAIGRNIGGIAHAQVFCNGLHLFVGDINARRTDGAGL
mmetsp:Transcript_18893/g.38889  ORF Transcript_18893/g.38889 Transcript_18893/m.38889 type:complete len:237 (+) Transcript_18893:214-924(+)